LLYFNGKCPLLEADIYELQKRCAFPKLLISIPLEADRDRFNLLIKRIIMRLFVYDVIDYPESDRGF